MKKSLFALTLCAMLLLIFACKKDKSGPATADFDVPGGQLYANCSVEFINASSGATTYLWDFGDGNASNEADPIHAYDTPGTYTITLTVSDEDTEDTATQTVQVGESTKFKKQFTLPVPATRNMQVMNASNGGYVGIASGLKGGRDGFMDVVIFKTDANGNFQWEISLEGFGSFISPGLTPTSDGGYLVSGRTEPIMYTDASALVIKIDANGILHWEGLFDDFFRIDATDMSDMVIGRNDGFHLLTFGANGNIQSDTYLGSSDFYISDIISTSDGGYILAGSKEVGTDNRDAYSTKVDKNGNLQWEKTFGGSGWDTFGSVTIASDGGFVFAGQIEMGQLDYDSYVIKTDVNGNLQWEKTFGDVTVFAFFGAQYTIVPASDGGYLLTGSLLDLSKIDANGNLLWEKPLEVIAYDMRQTNDCGYILTGLNDFGHYLIRTDGEGNFN